MTLHPTEDRLLVKPLKAKEKTKGGIILPTQEVPNRGVVVAAGPGRVDQDGNHIPMWITKGMVVQWSKYSPGEQFKDEKGEPFSWMRQSDILCVVGA